MSNIHTAAAPREKLLEYKNDVDIKEYLKGVLKKKKHTVS